MAALKRLSKALVCSGLLASSALAEDGLMDLALDRLQGVNSGEIDRKLEGGRDRNCPDRRKELARAVGRSLASDRMPDRGSYQRQREIAEASSGQECVLQRKAYQQQDDSLWAELGPEARADRIYKHARRTFSRLKAIKGWNVSSGSPFRDTHNPDFLDPLLGPELVACVMYQESKGPAEHSPHAVNYTFCSANGEGKFRSSAHGLGQVTFTTFARLSSLQVKPGEAPENLLPIKTVKGYDDEDIDRIFQAMNDDVPLQMEVVFRILNYKIKFARAHNEDPLLRAAIISYDQEDRSEYVRNVEERCMPCMKGLGRKKRPYSCVLKMDAE